MTKTSQKAYNEDTNIRLYYNDNKYLDFKRNTLNTFQKKVKVQQNMFFKKEYNSMLKEDFIINMTTKQLNVYQVFKKTVDINSYF